MAQETDGRALTFKPGTRVICENEVSRKMFIIRKGKARVYKTYLNHKITIAVLGEGEVFGELGFFDAQPRCASVEALTELSLVEIDGENAENRVSQLPGWVFSIMRQVFHRFRELDQKITVLQSMSEFQKKAFKTDTVAKTIYTELMRFIRTMELLMEKKKGSELKTDAFYEELDDLLGSRVIGLKVFWKQLVEHDIIDSKAGEISGNVVVNEDCMREFKAYVDAEVSSERYLLLKHSSIALMRKLLGYADSEVDYQRKQDGATVGVSMDTPTLKSFAFRDEAVEELAKLKLLTVQGNGEIVFSPDNISKIYTSQSILKAFDHTMVSVD